MKSRFQRIGSFPWVNYEVWELNEAVRYVLNGCPIDGAVKTLQEGKLSHRSIGAIRVRLRSILKAETARRKKLIKKEKVIGGKEKRIKRCKHGMPNFLGCVQCIGDAIRKKSEDEDKVTCETHHSYLSRIRKLTSSRKEQK